MTIKRQEPLPAILNAADLSNPALANSAVKRCCQIWQSIFRAELDRGVHRVLAARSAGEAYCGAMPSLTGEQNIRDRRKESLASRMGFCSRPSKKRMEENFSMRPR